MTSEDRRDRQEAWQAEVNHHNTVLQPVVTLPGADTFVSMENTQSADLLGDIWAAKDRYRARPEDVRQQGLGGWWNPSLRLLAWMSARQTDIPIVSTTLWDSAPGGRVQHILRQTPRRDVERARDFLSQFAPYEFVLVELGVTTPRTDLIYPCTLLARFRDNIYMVGITWHTRNTWEYTGKKGGFGRKGYVACTGGYECIMHNACIGGLGNTSSLPIVMINVVFENTPFWALGVYGRILKAPIPQYTAAYTLEYTAVYLEYTAVYWGYLFAPRGCFKLKNSIVVPFVPILLHSLPLPNNCTPLETNLGSYFTHDCNVCLHMCPFQSILCCFLLSQALFFCHND